MSSVAILIVTLVIIILVIAILPGGAEAIGEIFEGINELFD